MNRFIFLILALLPITASGQSLKEQFDQGLANCNSGQLTRQNAIERIDCINNMRTNLAQSSGYSHMGLIAQLGAANKSAAIAYSEGKISADQYDVAIQQNSGAYMQADEAANSTANAQRAQAWSNFGNALSTYSAIQQNATPRITNTNCNRTMQGMNCTSY